MLRERSPERAPRGRPCGRSGWTRRAPLARTAESAAPSRSGCSRPPSARGRPMAVDHTQGQRRISVNLPLESGLRRHHSSQPCAARRRDRRRHHQRDRGLRPRRVHGTSPCLPVRPRTRHDLIVSDRERLLTHAGHARPELRHRGSALRRPRRDRPRRERAGSHRAFPRRQVSSGHLRACARADRADPSLLVPRERFNYDGPTIHVERCTRHRRRFRLNGRAPIHIASLQSEFRTASRQS